MVRAESIPAGYSPGGHLARTGILAGAILGGALGLARGARALAWALLPAAWVFANFFEWTVHRFPMHRPLLPRIMFRNHAQSHHAAFTDQAMEMAEPRELGLVLMPWYTILMLFGAVSPVALGVGVAGGRRLAGIFYVGAISYFVMYETLHALYHVPPARLARIGLRPGGVFFRLRAHHAHHHIQRRMAHANFNVTFPLADAVLGTRESD